MRTFGALGVLRHELRDRGTRFALCQFKPEHDQNPDTLARYKQNSLHVFFGGKTDLSVFTSQYISTVRKDVQRVIDALIAVLKDNPLAVTKAGSHFTHFWEYSLYKLLNCFSIS